MWKPWKVLRKRRPAAPAAPGFTAFKVGDKVAIHPDSPWYERGVVSGTITAVDEPLGRFVDRVAPEFGITSAEFRRMFEGYKAGRPSREFEALRLHVVRIDPGGPFDRPVELAVDPSHLLPGDTPA